MIGEVDYTFKCTSKTWIVMVSGWAAIDKSINLLEAVATHYIVDKMVNAKAIVLTPIVSYLCLMVNTHVDYHCKIAVDLIASHWLPCPGKLGFWLRSKPSILIGVRNNLIEYIVVPKKLENFDWASVVYVRWEERLAARLIIDIQWLPTWGRSFGW